MIYPEFLNKNDTIGICAPSAGVGRKLNEHQESVKILNEEGYKVKETKSVRVNNIRSANAKIRAQELNELVCDKTIKMVGAATGGDYMYEILPYINFANISNNPKWYTGMSDPTNMLYLITTTCDIATFYGQNASSLNKESHSTIDFLKIISGKLIKQKSYRKYLDYKDYHDNILNYHDVKWLSKKPLNISGRLIGGCFEVIEKILGTPYDHTLDFINKYQDDGIIFYFDIFSKDPYSLYLSLLQMKYAGWFKHCKAILFSRVAYPQDAIVAYKKFIDKVLGRIPYIMEMDFGHTDAYMTLINGAIAKVNYADGKGDISFILK